MDIKIEYPYAHNLLDYEVDAIVVGKIKDEIGVDTLHLIQIPDLATSTLVKQCCEVVANNKKYPVWLYIWRWKPSDPIGAAIFHGFDTQASKEVLEVMKPED